jgi:Zn-dependent peptidase ImmA (M78 family)/transcriptional regulator with XRE-family HTH domain
MLYVCYMENLLGSKLKDLRESQALSLQQLADQIGIARQSIFKFENGLSKPGAETLLKISELFAVPFTHFYENPDGTMLDFDNIAFRDAPKIFDIGTHLKEVKKLVVDYVSKFLELELALGYSRQFDNPLEGVKIANEKDIEKAAKTLRKKWKIGNAPIDDVVETLESKGILIVEVNRSEDFLGLSGSINKDIPIIVLNQKIQTLERKRLTALHELGHIVLEFAEGFSDGKVEYYCDFFAGAVLIVDEAVHMELGKNRTTISLAELRRIKERYGISIQAIIIRAKQTDYIDQKTSDEWWAEYKEWYKGGDNQNDFGKFKCREQATRFRNMIVKGINEKKLSWSKAAELCAMKIDHLKQEFNGLTFNVRN